MSARIFKSPRGRRAPHIGAIPKAYTPIIRLWVLRLIHLGGGLFADRRNRPDLTRDALEAAGLGNLEGRGRGAEKEQMDAAELAFQTTLGIVEREKPSLPRRTALAQNLDWLGEAAGLNSDERTILHFIILAFHHPGLENALEQIGCMSLGSLQALLVRVLDMKPSVVAKVLDPGAPLSKTGLTWVDTAANFPFRGKVEVLSGLGDRMMVRHRDVWALFKTAFVQAPKPKLNLDQYPHVAKDLGVLEPYLNEVLRTNRKGVNILVHGAPGTGKSELVRAMAAKLTGDLYEVASENLRGGPVEGNDRFRGYRLAQAVLGRKGRYLVFFDEIEDIFRPNEDGPRSSRNNISGMKAWVNKTLEENPVPAFWVTNHVSILDDAFIRRFDLVIALDNPPRSVRKRMLDKELADLPVDDALKSKISQHEGLSPAVISRAAQVVRSIHASLGQVEIGPAFSRVIGNTLEALGYARHSRQAVEVVTAYRPEVVNTDIDLSPLLEGLRKNSGGRICFFGPPGTGKTAYGRHLAEQLDRPLLLKRASDILSMWVGGTERNIAGMFEEARTEGAVLLLDEADGFLQERSGAQRNFEVTQVGELLTQMEAFEGIFIASTNLMDRLDAAALRRFDLKVRFDYLRAEQAWVMFQDAAIGMGFEPTPALKGRLSQLGILTPGDFATVVRQARMNLPKDAPELLSRLEAECEVKPDHRRKPIGFSERAS